MDNTHLVINLPSEVSFGVADVEVIPDEVVEAVVQIMQRATVAAAAEAYAILTPYHPDSRDSSVFVYDDRVRNILRDSFSQ